MLAKCNLPKILMFSYCVLYYMMNNTAMSVNFVGLALVCHTSFDAQHRSVNDVIVVAHTADQSSCKSLSQ